MTTRSTPGAATTSPRRLGATVTDEGTRFEVWAPEARTVEVVVDAADGTMRVETLSPATPADGPMAADATWSTLVAGVGDGDRYRFRLDGGDPLPDPASRLQPDGVHGASMVVDTRFPWTDDNWAGVALDDAVLYELHVGTFTPEGTFDAAIGQLDRLVDLGITMIELMPVNAFPGERNWGYDGVFVSATQASYGGPQGLARLVDAAHARGLGVLLDVVYNHFGPEGNVLPEYGPYLTDEYSTPWGGAVNVAGPHSDSVRRFVVESAVGWITDLHLDGLRLDAFHAIVDPTARPLLAELTAAVHAAGENAGRIVLVTVESSANDARTVRDVAAGGWGADAVWNDDVHHALRVALTGEQHEYYAAYRGAADVAAAWQHRFVYRGQHSVVFGRRHGSDASDVDHRRFIAFTRNHDHLGNTPQGLRLLHDAPLDDPRRRLAAAAVVLSPFTPMLFMGEEYGERAPFPYFVDHGDPALVQAVREGRRREFSGVDWSGDVADPAAVETFTDAVLDPDVADRDGHRGLSEWYRRLLAIRREHRVLTDSAAEQVVDLDGGLMTVTRRTADASSTLILNFGDAERTVEQVDDPILASDPDRTATVGPHGVRLQVER